MDPNPAQHRCALRLAIAYVWITEDTYDKEYIAKHAYGLTNSRTMCWDGRTHSQDSRMGQREVRDQGMDHQGAGPGLGQKDRSIIHGNGGCYIRGPYARSLPGWRSCCWACGAWASPGPSGKND